MMQYVEWIIEKNHLTLFVYVQFLSIGIYIITVACYAAFCRY